MSEIVSSYLISRGYKRGLQYYNEHIRKKQKFSTVEKVAAVGSGAVIGYIHMNVPGAMVGAKFGYDVTADLPEIKMTSKASGFYRGKVPYGKKPKDTLETIALKSGYHATRETYGKVSDSNSAYILHSTFNADQFVTAYLGAAVRKVLMRAGVPILSANESIPIGGQANHVGYRFEIVKVNAVNLTPTLAFYETVAGDSFESIVANWATGKTVVKDWIINTVLAEPWSLCVYAIDGAVYRLLGRLQLQNEIITYFASSNIKFQNRTKGDLAPAMDDEADRVDNQPLKGAVYKFAHGEPRLRHNSAIHNNFNTSALGGVKLLRSAEMGLNYNNLPEAKMFANCTAKGNFVINPGEIKRSYIHYKITGSAANVMKKLRIIGEGGAGNTGTIGRSELVGFEEMLRTAGVNPVVVQYEVQHKTGVFLKTKGIPPIQSSVSVPVPYNLE